MSCDRRTVAACVFQGHKAAAHSRHECPLVQVLTRRVRNLGIEDEPAYIDHELAKYRAVARVLHCPLLAKLTPNDVNPRTTTDSPLAAHSSLFPISPALLLR